MRKAGFGMRRPTLARSSCSGSMGRTAKPNASRQSRRSNPSRRDNRSVQSCDNHLETGTTAPAVGNDTREATTNDAEDVVGDVPVTRSRKSYASDERIGSREATVSLPPRRDDIPRRANDLARARKPAAASRWAPDRRKAQSREAEARAWAPEGEPHASHETAAAAWFAIIIAARAAAHLARRRDERGARPVDALKGRGIGRSSLEVIASVHGTCSA